MGRIDERVSIAVRGEFLDEHVGVVTQVIAELPGGEPEVGNIVLDLRGARRCSRRALALVARLLDEGVRLARDPLTWAGVDTKNVGTMQRPAAEPIEAAGSR